MTQGTWNVDSPCTGRAASYSSIEGSGSNPSGFVAIENLARCCVGTRSCRRSVQLWSDGHGCTNNCSLACNIRSHQRKRVGHASWNPINGKQVLNRWAWVLIWNDSSDVDLITISYLRSRSLNVKCESWRYKSRRFNPDISSSIIVKPVSIKLVFHLHL